MNLRRKLEMTKDNETPMQCPHCGYIWNYGGNMQKATCPSCGYKCKVEENKIAEDSNNDENDN